MKTLRLIQQASCILIVSLLASCAATTTSSEMAATSIQVSRKTSERVSVSVSGGEPGPLKISDEGFAEALRTSIQSSGVFGGVSDQGPYRLDAFIGTLSQPMMGLSMTVEMKVSYTLRKGGSTVWQRTIDSTHTSTPGEAFVGVTRLRMATEGAARENIRQALQALSREAF
jgi:hypothetical protein